MTENDVLDCPHGARCGGCAWLGVPYAHQLERKRAEVQHAFARYSEHAALGVESVAGAEPRQGYRARAKLVFGPDGALGLFERDSHQVVDIPECRILAPALARVSAAARQVLSPALPALDGLDLRVVDDGVLVTLIAPVGTALVDLERLAQALCNECEDVRSVAASFREANAATVLGTDHIVLVGPPVSRHHLQPTGPYHLAAHGAFTQVHLAQANAAHDAIEARLTELGAARVLELYAGSGALSLRLCQKGFAMSAVEAFAPALAHAERAAHEQALTLTALTGPAERVLQTLRERQASFDALIVNPPRRGLSPAVRRSAAALRPRAILYMSCDPGTLARDLAHLRDLGYFARDLRPFDMIPHSLAVESLVVLDSGPPPPPPILYENEQWLAVLKSGYEPVVRERFTQSALVDRVRLLPGAREAVPLLAQRLDLDCSGVCWFARSSAALPTLERAFFTGASTFVGLARGVTHKRGRLRRDLRAAKRIVPACLRYQRHAVHGGHSLITIAPERATPAQLRELFSRIEHPLLGDGEFGDARSNTFFEHRHGLDRSFLHCSAVTLLFDAAPLTIEAPVPGELAGVLASLIQQTATPS